MNPPAASASRYLATNATITTVCRGLGLVSGIALDALIVALFGLSHQTDAYFAALAIPFLLGATMESQGPNILVPFFAESFEMQGREATWGHLSSLLAASGLLLTATAAVLTAGAWVVMPLQVPGLDAGTTRLAVQLHMITAWIVLTQGLGAVLAGALYADHHYVATTMSKFTTNVVTMAVAVLGFHALGIHALALGLVAGTGVQCLLLLAVMRWRGFRFGGASLRDPSVTKVLRLGAYPILGQTLSDSRVFLENFLGSFLGVGAVSVVRYANRIVGALASVLVGGVVTTSLPMLSHYGSSGRFEEMKEGLLQALRFVALLAVPVGLLLVFGGEPMVALAFQRGRFTGADAARLGLLLALLAPYILFSRVTSVAEIAFYAILDMRTPLIAIPAFLVTYVVLCLSLVGTMDVFAFAIATSIGSIVAAAVMVRLVEVRFGALPWAGARQFGRRLAVVSAVSVAGFALGSSAILLMPDTGVLERAARFLAVSLAGLLAFLGAGVYVQLFEWRHLRDVVTLAHRARGAAGAPPPDSRTSEPATP